MKKINIKAYAKLNLFLSIKGKRPDWYHEIEAVNTELDLYDEITLKETDREGIYIECKQEDIPKAEYNMCYRAAEIMQNKMPEKKGVIIELKKDIPVAAGLGGGSADAAAVMKGLNELWKLNLSESDLVYDAFKISSDTCYSIVGGLCMVKGKGSTVEKLGNIPKLPIIVVMPKVKEVTHKTKTMYKLYDTAAKKSELDIEPMLAAVKNSSIAKIASSIGNSFHDISYEGYSEVFKLLDELKKQCLNAAICGSGPAVFGICKDEKQMKKLHKGYKDRCPFVYMGFTR